MASRGLFECTAVIDPSCPVFIAWSMSRAIATNPAPVDLRPAHLTHNDAVGAHPEGVAHQVADLDLAGALDVGGRASSPCSGYNGTIEVTAGAAIRWTAPNVIAGRLPTPTDLTYDANPFEDLALWAEAGGTANGITGGGESSLTGVFFVPNADSFSLAGGSGQTIDLSAQFISRTLRITGGASINLVPNPSDAIPVVVYSTLLVR